MPPFVYTFKKKFAMLQRHCENLRVHMIIQKQKLIKKVKFFGSIVGIFLIAATAQAAPFSRNLNLGSTGPDVQALQQYLNNHGFTISPTGPGSPGQETTKFGSLTKQALIKFQEYYADSILKPLDLSHGTGNFFTATRNFINAQLATHNPQPLTDNFQLAAHSPSLIAPHSSGYYTIGGSITGLTGPVTLQNNSDAITVKPGDSSSFTFPTKLASGQSYAVTVSQAPTGERCYMPPGQTGSGVIGRSDITDIRIECTGSIGWNPFVPMVLGGVSSYTVGGSVSGLSGTVVLQNNGGNDISVNASGSFTFASLVASGNSYNVTVLTQPAGQTCVVANGSGTVAIANISSVTVTCTTNIQIDTVSPSSGPASGGTGVTLTGTGFTGTTGVTFGGTAATSVNVVNSTTVTAVTPANAVGSVDVVITTPSGSATKTNGFTYLTTAVGQSAYGGTIASLNGGLNNLIAAAIPDSRIGWGGNGTVTGATSPTDGAANTATIVSCLTGPGGGAGCPQNIAASTYAAGICSTYEVDSQGNTPCESGNACYNDWFLPAGDNTGSTGQLNALFTNKTAIGGFNSAAYWSSTEISSGSAWIQSFLGGGQGNSLKNSDDYFRCVRAFTP